MFSPKKPGSNQAIHDVSKEKVQRCMDWLQKQNSPEQKKLSLQNKNDIQFIIQNNTDRKNFLLKSAEDEATVPAGIDESSVEPKLVPLKKLRIENLRLECEWKSCRWVYSEYKDFQKHVNNHSKEVHVIASDDNPEYVCLWDICGHKTNDFKEMIRHINYHAYHSKLLAVGFNGRATLKLQRCQRDSSKRNQLPVLNSDHSCLWTGCDQKFNAIQELYDHVKIHVYYSDECNKKRHICSWAGCGAIFPRRVLLTMHLRSHTCERLIACYHCGMHFSCNRKLADHLRRQNVYPNSSHKCTVCGVLCSTAYLLREHARQHISAYVCAVCDMSAPTRAALALHTRYRHLAPHHARLHACPHCQYRAVTKSDLNRHIPTHTRRRKKESDASDEENSEQERKKKKSNRKYACHMCPEGNIKVFSRGTRLTSHLVKIHGAQWPFGHSRFRYQISEDGMYRLTTTRYEFLDVSKKIVDGYSLAKESLNNSFEYNLELKAEPTETTPRQFEITLKNQNSESESNCSEHKVENQVEITMCDVDEHGNIIQQKTIRSELIS